MLPYILAIGLLCLSSSLASSVANNTSVDDEDAYFINEKWSDAFDWKLLKAFCTPEYRNVLISPISLKLVLALLYEGASGNTEREFQHVLQFPAQKELAREEVFKILESLKASEREQYILNIGTRIFLDSEVSPQQQFSAKATKYYHTDIEPTNFSAPHEASKTINSWIDKLTNGRVQKLVQPDDLRDAIMLLGNAIYFKGTWRHQFPKNQTKAGGFYVTPDHVVDVPFMSTTDTFLYFESGELDAKILRLPYQGRRYSLFIVLPNSKGGLPDLIKKINLVTLKKQIYYLDPVQVDVFIPKFKFNFQARLSKILQDFGLHEMFQNTASFPGIARGVPQILRRLVVSDIVQKTGIDLDEEGSVVYAATEVQVGNKFGEADNIFNASHPFMFYIEEQNSGSILFVGKLENPLEDQAKPLPSRFGGEDEPVISNKPVTSTTPAPAVQPQPLAVNPTVNLTPNNPERDAIIKRFNYFDLEILKEVSEAHGNVFISPASIKTTLALILEGARGRSAQEIGDALRIDNINRNEIREVLSRLLFDLSDKSANTLIESTNAVFVADRLKILPEYQQKVSEYYKALVRNLDFTKSADAARFINSWASNATHGLINEIVSSQLLGGDVSVVITNALYFKGKWQVAFDPKDTKIQCFNSPTRGCVKTPLMQITDTFNYNLDVDLNAHAIELPYQDDKYSMLVLLPSSGNNIKVLARDMQHAKFNHILDGLKQTDLSFEMPKFDIEYNADLDNYLKPLKIRDIFSSTANLTGMIPQSNVRISNIVQKAKIEVNEQGTRAAAATSAVVIPLMGTTVHRVVADRPFLFFIYHKQSRNIIFEGILMEPAEASPSAPRSIPEQHLPTRVGQRIQTYQPQFNQYNQYQGSNSNQGIF